MIIEIAITTVKEFQEAYNIKIIDSKLLFLMMLCVSVYSIHKFYSGKKQSVNRKFYRFSLYVDKNYIRDCNASWLLYNILNNISKESINQILSLKTIDNKILITESEFYKLDVNKKRSYKKINNYYVICRFDYSKAESYVKCIDKTIKEKIIVKSV